MNNRIGTVKSGGIENALVECDSVWILWEVTDDQPVPWLGGLPEYPELLVATMYSD